MTSLYSIGNKLLIRDGKFAASVDCCCCPGSQEIYYSRNGTNIPEQPTDLGNASLGNCTCTGDCDTGAPRGCDEVQCCGDSLDTYLRSSSFTNKNVDFNKCKPKAKVISNGLIDDFGTIGDFNVPFNCGQYGVVPDGTELTPTVVNNPDGTFYLKIDISIQNGANICGSYGIESLTIRWFFKIGD